jgi:hypothetical protein
MLILTDAVYVWMVCLRSLAGSVRHPNCTRLPNSNIRLCTVNATEADGGGSYRTRPTGCTVKR